MIDTQVSQEESNARDGYLEKQLIEKLPLKCRTNRQWVEHVLSDPLQLLVDHAHLEKKAAANAMELLPRYPDSPVPENWVGKLSAVIQDESVHLRQVVKLLYRKGGTFSSFHRNPYAGELHKLLRIGQGRLELLDRLLVSALIELRSCERFGLLADPELNPDYDLQLFYRSLMASELGHYRVFLQLAEMIADQTHQRWQEMLTLEAECIQRQANLESIRMHSWI